MPHWIEFSRFWCGHRCCVTILRSFGAREASSPTAGMGRLPQGRRHFVALQERRTATSAWGCEAGNRAANQYELETAAEAYLCERLHPGICRHNYRPGNDRESVPETQPTGFQKTQCTEWAGGKYRSQNLWPAGLFVDRTACSFSCPAVQYRALLPSAPKLSRILASWA